MKRLMICALVTMGMAAYAAELTPATLNLPTNWTADIFSVSVHGTHFGMTKADVSNQHARYKSERPPRSDLDVLSYTILSVPEERIGIGKARPDVMVTCVKNIYFDQDERAVAIEMLFTNIDNDKRVHLLDQLERRYTSQPVSRKNFYRYTVSDNIQLETTLKPTAFETGLFGADMPSEYLLRNFYTHRTKYREALVRSQRAPLLDGLL